MLRRAIVSGYFAPGQHLSDRVLGETLAVSRTCVREAVRELEVEGLVRTVPHRGSFVRKVGLEEIRQIFDVRAAIESVAARNFAREASEEEIAALAAVVERLKAQEREGTVDDVPLKQEYYRILTSIPANAYARRLIGQILNQITVYRTASTFYPGRFQQSLHELGRIIEAFRRRDAELAARITFEHVTNAREVVVAIAERSEHSPSLIF